MKNFFMLIEPKLFLILITFLLYFLYKRSFENIKRENKLIYLFSFLGIVFSLEGNLMGEGFLMNLSYYFYGICCFFALHFALEYFLGALEYKLAFSYKILLEIFCFLIGFLSFYFGKSGLNTPDFLLVIILIIILSKEYYLKMSRDNLTKLYNRYGMDAELKEQLKQYRKEHSDSFYMIVCDLNNFKQINDTWGHPEGDRALVLVATALSKVGKMFDSGVFRIGGDEFVIITNKSEEGLDIKITDAVKMELDNIDFRDDFDIEMSIGVTLYDGVTSIDDLINNADKKMYEAKRKTKTENYR